MFSSTEEILATPTLQQIRRRRIYGRFTRSAIPIMRDAQRVIIRATKNTRILSLNKLAVRAQVDRHLVIRILANASMPDLLKLDAILRVTGNRLGIVPINHDTEE